MTAPESETSLQIASSENPGCSLSFVRRGGIPGDIDFDVEYVGTVFSGAVRCSTCFSGSPAGLFTEVARDWRGWSGEKIWGDIDGTLTLRATCDSLGHVGLSVRMRDPSGDQLEGRVTLEAGTLDNWARKMAQLLPD